jgi:hypothetical protein
MRAGGPHNLPTMHGPSAAETPPRSRFSILSRVTSYEERTDGPQTPHGVVALSVEPFQPVQSPYTTLRSFNHTTTSPPTTTSCPPGTLSLVTERASPPNGTLVSSERGVWNRNIWRRMRARLSPSSKHEKLRLSQDISEPATTQRFERDINLEMTLANGQRYKRTMRALIDVHCPCNLISPSTVECLPAPLAYETIERESYALTPAGEAYSIGRFKARWLCEDRDLFHPVYDEAEFRVMTEPLRCEVILGRPAIYKHGLLDAEAPLPLAAPVLTRTIRPSVDRMSSPHEPEA